MKEIDLRKWHRNIGIVVVFLIIVQGGSGLLLSFGWFFAPDSHVHTEEHMATMGHHEDHESLWHEGLESLHHGGNSIGSIFRLVVGIGTLAMAVTGGMIFFEMKARS